MVLPSLYLWLLLPAVENQSQSRCPQAEGKERQNTVSTAVGSQSWLPGLVNPGGPNFFFHPSVLLT